MESEPKGLTASGERKKNRHARRNSETRGFVAERKKGFLKKMTKKESRGKE